VTQICAELDRLHPKKNGGSYRELITFTEDRPGHDWRYALDCRETLKALNIKFKRDFYDGLLETVHWYYDRYTKTQAA
jgi:dTDP-glucose 4,6-dehydratase